ncbi:hypothetical protein GQ53DRAFT_741774 [Thozetella sp. PMI_491]|nr:hypothetical protein GQ53DRAFT_741774 [Thozetella sp. PMI_491]
MILGGPWLFRGVSGQAPISGLGQSGAPQLPRVGQGCLVGCRVLKNEVTRCAHEGRRGIEEQTGLASWWEAVIGTRTPVGACDRRRGPRAPCSTRAWVAQGAAASGHGKRVVLWLGEGRCFTCRYFLGFWFLGIRSMEKHWASLARHGKHNINEARASRSLGLYFLGALHHLHGARITGSTRHMGLSHLALDKHRYPSMIPPA